jgi:tetratricopeptide (TPR) repeat protein
MRWRCLIGQPGAKIPDTPESVERRLGAIRLIDAAYDIAKTDNIVDHWTFSSILETKAAASKKAGDIEGALNILDEGYFLSRSDKEDGRVNLARVLGAYASVFEYLQKDSNTKKVFATLNLRFAELVAMSDPKAVASAAVSGIIDALVQYGETYLENEIPDNAIRAYQLAQRLANSRSLSIPSASVTSAIISPRLTAAIQMKARKIK